MSEQKCFQCLKCGKHWGGIYGKNNANECCKLTDIKEILEKQKYWNDINCDDCGEKMRLDLVAFNSVGEKSPFVR